jgi:hypothetical protein
VHRQIFECHETIDYALMGQNPDAADNRWLREAFENKMPIIYFLGIAPALSGHVAARWPLYERPLNPRKFAPTPEDFREFEYHIHAARVGK